MLALTQEVPVRDTVAFRTVRCMTWQPRRHRLGCDGNTAAAAHLQYILIAGYSAAVAAGTVCSTHVVLPSALAVVQRTGHSRKVSGSNPDMGLFDLLFPEIA